MIWKIPGFWGIIAIIWLICGIIDYGVCLADLQSFGANAPAIDRLCAAFFSICGPFGLIVILCDRKGRKGFKL